MARKQGGKRNASPMGGRRAKSRELTDFEKLLQKAIEDKDFARRLMLHPNDALQELNIEVTPEKISALADCEDPLCKAYEAFGGITKTFP